MAVFIREQLKALWPTCCRVRAPPARTVELGHRPAARKRYLARMLTSTTSSAGADRPNIDLAAAVDQALAVLEQKGARAAAAFLEERGAGATARPPAPAGSSWST